MEVLPLTLFWQEFLKHRGQVYNPSLPKMGIKEGLDKNYTVSVVPVVSDSSSGFR